MLDNCKDLLEALWFLAWCPVVLFSLLDPENFPGIIIRITLIYTNRIISPELFFLKFSSLFNLLSIVEHQKSKPAEMFQGILHPKKATLSLCQCAPPKPMENRNLGLVPFLSANPTTPGF